VFRHRYFCSLKSVFNEITSVFVILGGKVLGYINGVVFKFVH
jgi:hypothetical protein